MQIHVGCTTGWNQQAAEPVSEAEDCELTGWSSWGELREHSSGPAEKASVDSAAWEHCP